MAGLLKPAQVDQSARMPGGVLSKALPAPAGWEDGGLVIPFYGCGAPVLRDKCDVDADPDEPHRSTVGEFHAFPFEQGATCSTSGPDSQQTQALARFTATADWAVGRQLQTDQAETGDPKLDDVTSVGTVADADFVKAVSCLEGEAAATGFGARLVLHAPVRAAAYLASLNLIDANGLSPAGAPWVISAGYVSHPSDPAKVRLYATGTVWASISDPTSVDGVAYRTNDQESWARGVGVAAFDPCILVGIDVTIGACP